MCRRLGDGGGDVKKRVGGTTLPPGRPRRIFPPMNARAKASPFPPKTLADLDALPRYKGKPQPIEAISRLSDEDILRLLK